MDQWKLPEVEEAVAAGGFKDWLDNQRWDKVVHYSLPDSPFISIICQRDVIYGGHLWKIVKDVIFSHINNVGWQSAFCVQHHSWSSDQWWSITSDTFQGFEEES